MSTREMPVPQSLESNDDLLDQLVQRLRIQPGELILIAKRAVERTARTFEPETLLQLLKVQGDEHTWGTFGRIGLSLRIPEVINLTGKSKSGLHKAKDEGRLMAFRLPGQSVDLFPLLQFEGKDVRSWIPELLSCTGNGPGALQFLTARRVSLAGGSYAEKLIDDNFSPDLVDTMLQQGRRIGHAGS